MQVIIGETVTEWPDDDDDPGSRRSEIQLLNDALRQWGKGGQVMKSCGVAALPEDVWAEVFVAVRLFEEFDENNDPHGEHDFGQVTVGAVRVFWKIDYYDRDMRMHSPDPADPVVTCRVLTIMLAEEY